MKLIKAIGNIFKKRPLVIIVRLEGVIGAVSRFGSGGLDDSNTQKLFVLILVVVFKNIHVDK